MWKPLIPSAISITWCGLSFGGGQDVDIQTKEWIGSRTDTLRDKVVETGFLPVQTVQTISRTGRSCSRCRQSASNAMSKYREPPTLSIQTGQNTLTSAAVALPDLKLNGPASDHEAADRLEPCALKGARTVLRGGCARNSVSLPD